MKLKFTRIFAGAIAAAAIAATPLAAFAQTQAPSSNERPRIVFDKKQQADFEQIQARTFTAIEAVLKPEQKAQFVAQKETLGIRALQAVKDLDESQTTQIRTILQKANSDIGDLLTQEQKNQIREWQMRNQPNQPNR